MLQARNKYGKKRGFKYIVTGVAISARIGRVKKMKTVLASWTLKGKETRTADELLERNSRQRQRRKDQDSPLVE